MGLARLTRVSLADSLCAQNHLRFPGAGGLQIVVMARSALSPRAAAKRQNLKIITMVKRPPGVFLGGPAKVCNRDLWARSAVRNVQLHSYQPLRLMRMHLAGLVWGWQNGRAALFPR